MLVRIMDWDCGVCIARNTFCYHSDRAPNCAEQPAWQRISRSGVQWMLDRIELASPSHQPAPDSAVEQAEEKLRAKRHALPRQAEKLLLCGFCNERHVGLRRTD
jgi:hypothetical protein